jgi:hypothetical protein
VKRRIESGDKAAVEHDCEKDGCLIPNQPYRSRVAHRRKFLVPVS